MSGPSAPSGSRRTLMSVRNAARLLKSFNAVDRELGVTELAHRLGLGKSTVHRLLATLTEERLVEQDAESGRYRLGLAIHELGAATTAPTDLHAAVMMPMSVLRLRTGETVQIAVLDGREVVYVERLESPHTRRMFLEVGHRNQAHRTGTGKCLLAYLEERALERLLDGWKLEGRTVRTITDADRLRAELREIRTRGYAINAGEHETGVMSVAAPIRDGSGRVVASMSVAGPNDRMEPDLDRIIRSVVEAAATASRRLSTH